MLTSDELIVGMKVLVRHFPDAANFDAETWGDYHAVLSNFDITILALALRIVMQEYVYPTAPKPAVIYQAGVRALMERDGYSERWARDVLGDVSTVLDKLELEAQARISPPAPKRGGGEGKTGETR